MVSKRSEFVEEIGRYAEGQSIVQMVESIVLYAHAQGVSDVHISPLERDLRVRMRIDGVLQDVVVLPRSVHSEVISRLKILSSLRTDEHQTAQDGRFRTQLANSAGIDVRVSIVPTYYGENAVLRVLADKAEEFTLESLDFTPDNREKIERAIKKPYGMILATGPTGSGKTTNLYTLVKMLNNPGASILTIEDPVEYAIAGINQIQVNTRTGLTFAHGLRSMLRQDPNIIMVGEIRDIETAGLAVNVALTGHLVLSTLHTNDAPTTLPRLLDMKVEPYLIASTVNIVVGQRLLRRICKHCKQERLLTSAEKKSLSGVVSEKLLSTHTSFFVGAGCDECSSTGYRGRVGVHEVMEVGAAVREAILKKVSASELRDIAIKEGMLPMFIDGFTKAAAGLTTIAEVLRMQYE